MRHCTAKSQQAYKTDISTFQSTVLFLLTLTLDRVKCVNQNFWKPKVHKN